MKLLSIVASLVLSVSAFASSGNPLLTDMLVQPFTTPAKVLGMNLTVGDEADYSLNMGIVKGTIHSFVREEVNQGFWIQQDMSLGFMGEQKVEILIDPNSGQIIQLLVNGEKQDIPDGSNQEVIDMHEDEVTVAAGTFECIYVKVLDTKENKESEAWINPQTIPVLGLIKQIAPGPFGEVVVELTGYDKK